MSDSEDEGTPQLSSHALAALQEFYAEQKQRADSGAHDKYDLGVIEENWVSRPLHSCGEGLPGAAAHPRLPRLSLGLPQAWGQDRRQPRTFEDRVAADFPNADAQAAG